MSGKIGGQRPRPRVALLGDFEASDVEHFKLMFPTVWSAKNIQGLEKLVDVREIDLIIIASGIDLADDWPEKVHVICFSDYVGELPGPVPESYIRISGEAETEEFLLPEVPLPISRRREVDYCNLTSVRGWTRLSLNFRSTFQRGCLVSKAEQETALSIFNGGKIICEYKTGLPLAVAFNREESNHGVGWLPCMDKNQAAWVELLVTQWAHFDKETFHSFGDWTSSSEWMVAEEEQILSQIQALEKKRQENVNKITKEIDELNTKLSLKKASVNKGRRRLITKQGSELVDEVAKALKDIGFDVTKMDEIVSSKGPRKEDLRLKHLDSSDKEWNAIVEVRGYARSGGKTDDLLRINRFAELYRKETGQEPDKRIYIVNSETELLPPQRQIPLASSNEDLEVFSEMDGIIIWSVELFKVLKVMNPNDYPTLLESIKTARGRWLYDMEKPSELADSKVVKLES